MGKTTSVSARSNTGCRYAAGFSLYSAHTGAIEGLLSLYTSFSVGASEDVTDSVEKCRLLTSLLPMQVEVVEKIYASDRSVSALDLSRQVDPSRRATIELYIIIQ